MSRFSWGITYRAAAMKKPKVTDVELVTILGTLGRPDRKHKFDSDTVLPMVDQFQHRSDSLASHGLNRVATWLDGPGGRWAGDDRLRATWESDVCTLEHDGVAWRVSLEKRNGKGAVELSRVDPDGGTTSLAEGNMKSGNGITWRQLDLGTDAEGDVTFQNSVDGSVALGAFQEFCDFMDVVKPSIPSAILDVVAGTVWITQISEFLDARELVQLDGGLPGRLARTRDNIAQSWGAQAGLLSVLDRYEALASGLSEAGAVWGQGVIGYNDGDNRCCTVSMEDGSVALYSEHTGSGSDQRGYVAVFEVDGEGAVHSVSGYLLEGDDDAAFVSAIADRTAVPDFRFDVAGKHVEFADGRKGHVALRLMLIQFAYDEDYAFENGELKLFNAATAALAPAF